jgi:putative ABC transport system ATP-binding protein
MGVFQKLNDQGITIIMVTHELDIARYCRRNLILRDGALVRDELVTDRLIAAAEMLRLKEAEAAKLTSA